MQVDLSAVVGFLGAIMGVVSLIIVTLGRIAITGREKELDRRIDAVTAESKAIDARLHTEEKATIRQDGEIKLVEQNHGTLLKDIEEIKREMATKTDINHMMQSIDNLGRRGPPYAANPSSSTAYRIPSTGSPPPTRPKDDR